MSSKSFGLVFVCLGNICRSPLAEAICRHLAVERGLSDQLRIDSCGTGSWHIGEKPHVEILRVADKHQIKMDGIKARQIVPADLQEFDLVVVMDRQNLSDVEDIHGGASEHIVIMRDYDSQRDSADVPDPYFGGRDGFQEVYEILYRSVEQLLDTIEEDHLKLMFDAQLRQHLEDALLESAITEVRPCGGGSINDAYLIECSNKDSYFLKTHPAAPEGFFAAEAYGLELLGNSGVVRVPGVVAVGEGDQELPQFLLLEALNEGERSTAASAELGRGLARLHSMKVDQFGLEKNNYIGLNSQINGFCSSWGEFFVEKRLGFQMSLGRRMGTFSRGDEKALDNLKLEIISALNSTGHPPVLPHGDLWGGNVFWSDTGPVLIDPAVYYGDREADLAFTEMFGGFDREFYRGYEEVFPFTLNYELRKKILNLYHVMNHANLFGGGYISSTRATLRELKDEL